MTNIKYPRGSEWRKWDLHIHTKGTAKNDQFISNTFDEYCKILFKEALSKKIAAIGITDYFNIENYKKVVEFIKSIDTCKDFSVEEKEKIKKIFILPNVELRMMPVTDSGRLVNIHCIFNPGYVGKLDNDFFGNIEYSAGSRNKFKMNKQGLIDLGKSLDPEITTPEDQYKKGLDNFTVSHESLQKLCDENIGFKDNCIIVVSNSNSDGASALQKHYSLFENTEPGSLEAVRKSIYNLSQMIFSGNPKDRQYFLGKKKDSIKKVKQKCGSIKPCVHGSDAHTEENLFAPKKDRFCWIKADLTFEGLKQIIYEPEDRVFIGEEPSVLGRVKENKTKYIQSLKISNKAGKKAKKGKWFQNVELLFNSELVAIIGNKGSGKSAISDILGVLADTHHAGVNHSNLSFLSNSKHKKFRKKGFAENFKAKLTWQDSTFIEDSLDKNIDKNKPEKVKYLPQNYFESLTNDLEEEGFENALKEVIFLHIPKSHRYGLSSFEELEQHKTASILKDIPLLESKIKARSATIINLENKKHSDYISAINNTLDEKQQELKEHIKNMPQSVKNPSSSKGAKSEKKKEVQKIESLNARLETLEKNIADVIINKNVQLEEKEDLTQILDDLNRFAEEIFEYTKANAERFTKYGIKVGNIFQIKVQTEFLKKEIKVRSTELTKIRKKLKDVPTIELEFVDLTSTKAKEAVKNSLVAQRRNVLQEINNLRDKLSEPERKYQAYKEKLKKWELLKTKIEGSRNNPHSTPKTLFFYKSEKKFVETKLSTLITIERKKRTEEVMNLFAKKKDIISLYKDFKTSIDKEIEKDKEFRKKFRMEVDVSFKISRQFVSNFLTYINQGKKGTFYGAVDGEKFLEKILEEKDLTLKSDVESILRTIIEYLEFDQRDSLNGKPREISDQIDQIEEFYNFIFTLKYLEPNYELKLDDKTLEELSPGEKGALLLVFYLMIDKEDTPLIIDQPEDNLDNKSVFEVLTHFMKFAKKRRQIIIVTHNPNLAVGADAEQIIHVNLNKKKSYEFSYQTGSIENPKINRQIVDILEGTKPAFDKRKLKYFNG